MNKQSHKRGLVAFSLVLIILFSAFACKKPEGGQAAESITAKTNSKFEPETDVNNRYVLAGYLMVELDNMYIWKPSISECSLRYYDKETGESDVLCAKPECLHDANGGNRECGGYAAPGTGGGLSYYKGKLYWLDSDSSGGEIDVKSLYRMNPDSTEREMVRRLRLPPDTAPQEFYVHRGKIYGRCVNNSVVQSDPRQSVTVICADLDAGDFETVLSYEFISEVFNPFSSFIRFVGDNVYLAFSYTEADGSCIFKVLRWNAQKGEAAEVVSSDIIAGAVNGFWIDENEDMLIVPTDNDPSGMIYRVHEGTVEAYLDRRNEDGKLLGVHLSDGIIVCCDSPEDGSYRRTVWIRDFEGKTLYRGELPMHFLEGKAEHIRHLTVASTHGDSDGFIVNYRINYDRAFAGSGHPTACYFVRYTFTESGLAEEELIRYDEVSGDRN